MKICIICREEKSDFNDEHVIPDSIKGYYHINSVCTDCNSKMGSAIDHKLTNHKFIIFQRHLLGIKGKSGHLPNPFSETATLKENPEQKVRLELDSEGKFVPRFLPNIPSAITNKFTIIIDKKDEHKKDTIIQKFLKRNGISKESVKIEEGVRSSERPWIHSNFVVDIHDFKLALLKIAYEFTVDNIPNYFNNPKAVEISKLLKNADFENIDDKVQFMGDGFTKQILEPFSHLIDFDDNNHYLILFDSTDIGLICFVNLFNVFSIGIIMSSSSFSLPENLLVGKNDIVNKNFKIYNLNQLLIQTYTPIEYRFEFFLPKDPTILNEFLQNDRSADFAYYRNNDSVPFFDRNGNIVYSNIDTKLQQNQLRLVQKGNIRNELITQIILDEELYIKLLPIDKLYRVTSVQIEQFRRNKL